MGYILGMPELHAIAAIRMVGEPEDELVTVMCVCGWESPRAWSSDDSISAAFAEHLRTEQPAV
jgi:hypothetical protein